MSFSFASGSASRKVCIGVLPKHQRPLMGPLLVVLGNPSIKVGLQLVDRAVDLFPEHHPVELIQDGAMEALTNSIRLRALGLGTAVINVLDGEIELIFVALGAAKFGAAIG